MAWWESPSEIPGGKVREHSRRGLVWQEDTGDWEKFLARRAERCRPPSLVQPATQTMLPAYQRARAGNIVSGSERHRGSWKTAGSISKCNTDREEKVLRWTSCVTKLSVHESASALSGKQSHRAWLESFACDHDILHVALVFSPTAFFATFLTY